MRVLNFNVAAIAELTAPKPRGVWIAGHIKHVRECEAHNLTLIHGGKYGVVGKGIYAIRKQVNNPNNTPPLNAA